MFYFERKLELLRTKEGCYVDFDAEKSSHKLYTHRIASELKFSDINAENFDPC